MVLRANLVYSSVLNSMVAFLFKSEHVQGFLKGPKDGTVCQILPIFGLFDIIFLSEPSENMFF